MTVTINGTTGITSPEVVLDNAAADGGQVVLKSSGYSDWNWDNYSGRLRAYYSATEYFTITNSGNVGIGTASPSKKFVVSNAGAAGVELDPFTRSATTGASLLAYNRSGSAFVRMDYDAEQHLFFTSGTERVRIDGSGNLGVGTGSNTAFGRVDSVASSYAAYVARATTTGVGKSVDALKVVDATAANFATGIYSASAHIWNYNGSVEAMRIDTSGNLLVGTTATYATNSRLSLFVANNTSHGITLRPEANASYRAVNFNNSAGSANVGFIDCTTTATTYSTSSDYRLKENIQPMTGALATVAQLKPVTYTWKADGSAGQGFIAHELQEVVPDCVTGEKDAVETYIDEEGNEQTRPVYQGIDTSFLVATLTAAIQEQQALITTLTARIEALEAKNA